MLNAAILCAGIGNWYGRGVARLVESVARTTPDACAVLAWSDVYPSGSEPYARDCPYTVKPFCFREAQRRGFDVAIWLDASCFAVRSIEPLIYHVIDHGTYCIDNGYLAGQWMSDAALGTLGVTREESFAIPEISTMALGLDLRRPDCQGFLNEWEGLATDGKTFPGFHTNAAALDRAQGLGIAYRGVGFVSDDPRVLGHRHDQTAASVLAWRRGWKRIARPRFVDYWTGTPDERTLLVSRGM